jgi:hypothetical protein
VNEKPLSRTAKEFVAEVAYGFKEVATHAYVGPWEVSRYFIDEIERIETGPEDLKGNEILITLEIASGVSFNKLRRYWERLSIRERKEAIHKIKQAMASLGLITMVGTITVHARPSQKEEILGIAMKYDKGEIDYEEMVADIEDVLWPTEAEKAKYWKDIEEYKRAMALAKYLPTEIVKRVIKAYFIDMIRLQMYDTYLLIPSVYPNFLE